MKCFINSKRNLSALLAAGVVLAALGIASAGLMGEEAGGLPMRLAGFATGLGAALATIGGGGLLYGRLAGEKRAHEQALAMSDERGRQINLQAQAALGFAAVATVIAFILLALIRGDTVALALGVAGCAGIAATGVIARVWLGKRM